MHWPRVRMHVAFGPCVHIYLEFVIVQWVEKTPLLLWMGAGAGSEAIIMSQ
jgi:hypothetical protein